MQTSYEELAIGTKGAKGAKGAMGAKGELPRTTRPERDGYLSQLPGPVVSRLCCSRRIASQLQRAVSYRDG
jgi:hypothetical protein